MSFAIFRSDSSAVASSHKEMTSFDLGVNFLASFIKVTEMSDMSKLKKQDPVTLSDLSREIIRVCAEKDSGVKSHIQVPGVDDEVGRVMVLIRELYKVKAEAVFNEVHKDADRVSTYKTLVRLYYFVWGGVSQKRVSQMTREAMQIVFLVYFDHLKMS